MSSCAATLWSISRRGHEVDLAGCFAIRLAARCLHPHPAASFAIKLRGCPGRNTQVAGTRKSELGGYILLSR
jgi:hypothetical protein